MILSMACPPTCKLHYGIFDPKARNFEAIWVIHLISHFHYFAERSKGQQTKRSNQYGGPYIYIYIVRQIISASCRGKIKAPFNFLDHCPISYHYHVLPGRAFISSINSIWYQFLLSLHQLIKTRPYIWVFEKHFRFNYKF